MAAQFRRMAPALDGAIEKGQTLVGRQAKRGP
jgi:hypothetical protein